MVTSNWLKLPTIVSIIALIGSVFFRIKTRPINSPTLFGVKTLTARPPSTAWYAFPKLTLSDWLISNFHFSDSIPQLIPIRKNIPKAM